jgi:hypothetical protein
MEIVSFILFFRKSRDVTCASFYISRVGRPPRFPLTRNKNFIIVIKNLIRFTHSYNSNNMVWRSLPGTNKS